MHRVMASSDGESKVKQSERASPFRRREQVQLDLFHAEPEAVDLALAQEDLVDQERILSTAYHWKTLSPKLYT